MMLKRNALVMTVVVAVLSAFSVSRADDKENKVNLKGIKCMMCKMQVSEDAAVDYKGAKLYFGCAACPPTFEKNTAKYAAKANAQLVATKQAKQKACPVMSKPCDKEVVKMKLAGTEVSFCCAKCKTGVAKLGTDAQIEKVFNEKAFKKAFEVAKQTKK